MLGTTHSLEVASMVDLVTLDVEERVVCGAIEFCLDLASGKSERLELRSDPLCASSESISVLSQDTDVVLDSNFAFLGDGKLGSC